MEQLGALLARALERAGHGVVAVGDGLDALGHLVADRFDILLADIVMPGMDGIELARRAADDDPNLRIMLITGFAAVALKAQAAGVERTRVLSKPIHLRELVDQVDMLLAG